jgi:hypothetical protein
MKNKADKQFNIILSVAISAVIAVITIAFLNFDKIKASQVGRSISGLSKLQDQLSEKYNHSLINIRIHNNKSLTVNFINSPFSDLNIEEKKLLAEEIANLSGSIYEDKANLENIAVAFGKYRNFLVMQYNNNMDTYSFQFDADRNLWTLCEEDTEM